MTVDLEFPCDPRFTETVCEAVSTAVRGVGVTEDRVLAVGAAVERFLADCVHESTPASIVATVSQAQVCVRASDRVLTLDL